MSEGLSVLVDGRGIGTSGIGRYTAELVPRIARDPRIARVTIFGPSSIGGVVGPGVTNVRSSGRFYSAWSQVEWLGPLRRLARRHEVLLLPHYDGPLIRPPVRSVVVVHDLTHFLLPDLFPMWKRALAGVSLAASVARAKAIVTPSARTAADLEAHFAGVADRVRIAPNGVDDLFRNGSERASKGAPYALCVGARKRHKRIVAAIDALMIARNAVPDLRLVVIGRAGDGDGEIRERIAARGAAGLVEFRNTVSDDCLARAYASALALVLPSRYEGFGLPALEAMAAGTPVIVSDGGALPEVVGDVGFIVPGADPGGIATWLVRLAQDSALVADVGRRGRARAKSFTWDRCAATVVDSLVQAAETAPTPITVRA
jgi:O-antigen biosynthesis alpha-1,3-rhamnosyltransferase